MVCLQDCKIEERGFGVNTIAMDSLFDVYILAMDDSKEATLGHNENS